MASKENENGEKKKKPKIFLILILAFVLLGGGLGLAYHFYGQKFFGPKDEKNEVKEVKQEKKGEAKIGPILTLDPFLLNLSGSIARYAKVSVSIELNDAKSIDYAKKVTPAMRDRIIQVLGSKKPEELLDVKERETLKTEIAEKIKDLFSDASSVKAVYITDVVVQ